MVAAQSLPEKIFHIYRISSRRSRSEGIWLNDFTAGRLDGKVSPKKYHQINLERLLIYFFREQFLQDKSYNIGAPKFCGQWKWETNAFWKRPAMQNTLWLVKLRREGVWTRDGRVEKNFGDTRGMIRPARGRHLECWRKKKKEYFLGNRNISRIIKASSPAFLQTKEAHTTF